MRVYKGRRIWSIVFHSVLLTLCMGWGDNHGVFKKF